MLHDTVLLIGYFNKFLEFDWMITCWSSYNLKWLVSDNCLACNHVLFHVDFEQYLIVIVDGCFQIYLYFEGFR